MRRSTLLSLSFAWVLGFGATALVAGDAQAGVNGREHEQRQRIRAGVQDGSLNGREAHRLARKQVRTERIEQRMRADDGKLGPRERARLDQRLDRSSAGIYRQRRDAQAR